MKITANLVVFIWISLMSLIGLKAFVENERESLFIINKTSLFSKYVKLILAQIILNLPLLLCIGFQLFFLRQDILKTLELTIIFYMFAIMFGFLLGNTVSKTSGIIILVLVFLYNFFLVNPYKMTEYTYLLGVNEFLFNLDNLNKINILKMLFIILLGIFTVFINRKYLFSKNGKLISFTFLIMGFIILECVQYRFYIFGENTELKTTYIKDRKIIYTNVDILEYSKGVEILQKVQNSYMNLGGSTVKCYMIKKEFLSSLEWKFIKQSVSYELEKECLKINIYSLANLNFYDPAIVYSMAGDIAGVWKQSIPNYVGGNRYFRHIIDGSEAVFISKTIKTTFGENSRISKYAQNELDDTYKSPITKNNYVKRIGILVADKYEDQLAYLIKILNENKLDNNEEFIKILKDKFFDIYQDPYIYDFLKRNIKGVQ
ncbi:hypothetical protein [Caviibacter abscessus]|uniref:hypothetical protein n=1 Tax=Caviibacter abscessus TaxID=1766719 RepID=UPI00082F6ECD|nr:hypothetical protein [Caviibacter abscessus]